MDNYENNAFFWQKIDTLVFSSKFVLSRKKGEQHPEYKNLIYPVDYGHYIDLAAESNEGGIAVYRGSEKSSMVKTAVVAADILQKESDVKLLVGCSKAEEDLILRFLNQTDFQKTILIRRGNEIPEWGLTD